MRFKKLIFWMNGCFFAAAFLAGLLMLIPSEGFRNVIASIIVCLSICGGLLLPNHFSIFAFAAGVAMLVFPAHVACILLLSLAVVGAVTNLLVSRKVAI